MKLAGQRVAVVVTGADLDAGNREDTAARLRERLVRIGAEPALKADLILMAETELGKEVERVFETNGKHFDGRPWWQRLGLSPEATKGMPPEMLESSKVPRTAVKATPRRYVLKLLERGREIWSESHWHLPPLDLTIPPGGAVATAMEREMAFHPKRFGQLMVAPRLLRATFENGAGSGPLAPGQPPPRPPEKTKGPPDN